VRNLWKLSAHKSGKSSNHFYRNSAAGEFGRVIIYQSKQISRKEREGGEGKQFLFFADFAFFARHFQKIIA
jgi:hypothetical protein